jgi:predicted unusual protein kinase regulating ubiquinone biosynthesis (AarF/ABC1/UbiB family)
MMLVDNLIHSDLHPGNILVRLEPPSGLLGVAYRALSSLLDATGGAPGVSGCGEAAQGQPRLRFRRESSGAGEGEGEQIEGVPACGSASKGDGADCVSASRDPKVVVVPGVARMHQRKQQQQQQRGGSGGESHEALHHQQHQQQQSDGSSTGPQQQQQQQRPQRHLSITLAGPLRERLAALRASWLQPRIVLLDVGMATELSTEDQTNMVGLFKAFSQLEGGEAADWVLRFSGDQQACKHPDEFRWGFVFCVLWLSAPGLCSWTGMLVGQLAHSVACVSDWNRSQNQPSQPPN